MGHHLVERVVQRAQIRIDFRLEIARKESETLAGFDRGAREDNPAHSLSRKRIDRSGYCEIRFSSSRGTDSDDDVIVENELEVFRLTARFWLNDFPYTWKSNSKSVFRSVPITRRFHAHAENVVGGERHLLLCGFDHSLRDRGGTTHRVLRASERQRVATK